MGGQLERVITTKQDGNGQTIDRKQVEYRYDPQGIRFIATDYVYNSQTSTFTLATSTEYLIDHANFTGYQQTIIETTKNATGQTTKRISYTYGLDEITQTTTAIDPSSQLITQSSTLTFAHDGHGSTRVLFEAAAAIAQIYTYSAYGELLAIHNTVGAVVGVPGTPSLAAQTLTSMLYNGESFDIRINQLYLRARWYSQAIGQFERLDPFAGDRHNPQSFSKYGFSHGDPIQGIDPTGMWTMTQVVSGLAIASIGLNLGITYIASNRIGRVMARGEFPISGIVFSASLGAASFGAQGNGVFTLFVDFKRRDVFIFGGFEAGLAPISYFKTRRGDVSRSYGFGVAFGVKEPNDLGGYGFTAYWPIQVMQGVTSSWSAFPTMRNMPYYMLAMARHIKAINGQSTAAWSPIVNKRPGTLAVSISYGNEAGIASWLWRDISFGSTVSLNSNAVSLRSLGSSIAIGIRSLGEKLLNKVNTLSDPTNMSPDEVGAFAAGYLDETNDMEADLG